MVVFAGRPKKVAVITRWLYKQYPKLGNPVLLHLSYFQEHLNIFYKNNIEIKWHTFTNPAISF